MKTVTTSALAIVGGLICATSAFSQTPVALVEEVRGSPAGLEFMDYVSAGTIIELRPGESIVLGYLTSCWHENITGGTVVVGSDYSEVRSGKVNRRRVPCDGGKMVLAEGQANQSAGTSFRSPDDAPLTLYGLSPVVAGLGSAPMRIVRVDRGGESYVANMPVVRGERLSYYDFEVVKKRLSAGGTYRASIADQQMVFRIHPSAKARVPIISRLVRFPTIPTTN